MLIKNLNIFKEGVGKDKFCYENFIFVNLWTFWAQALRPYGTSVFFFSTP